MDAWSYTISADIDTYGYTKTLSYYDTGQLPQTLNQLTTQMATSLISTSNNNLPGQFPQVIKVFSDAAALINTNAQLGFMNTDPIIFLSVPGNRVDAFNYINTYATKSMSNIKSKITTSDFGCDKSTGWSALSIIDEMKNMLVGVSGGGGGAQGMASFSYSMDFSSWDYPVNHYRVEPYSNILTEFRRLFGGLPVIFRWTVSSGAGQANPTIGNIEAKLITTSLTKPISMSSPNKSFVVKFIPHKMSSIVVLGTLGEPAKPAFGGTGSSTNKVTNFTHTLDFSKFVGSANTTDVYWGTNCPNVKIQTSSGGGGASAPGGSLSADDYTYGNTVDTANLMVGYLDASTNPLDTDYVKNQLFSLTNSSPSSLGTPLNATTERSEVLVNGFPLFTLTSASTTTNDFQYFGSAAGNYVGAGYQNISSTMVGHANVGVVISAGESKTDIKTSSLVTKSCILSDLWIKKDSSAVTPENYRLITSYNVTFTIYEDMFNSNRNVMYNSSTAVGRKKEEQTFDFVLYFQLAKNFYAKDFENIVANNCQYPKGSNINLTDYVPILCMTTWRQVSYVPVGTSGYTRVIKTISYEPTDKQLMHRVQDGSGDSGAYVSQLSLGPGSVRVRGTAGSGEPETITIFTCSTDEANSYASKLISYKKGYYEVIETTETGNCNSTPPGTYNFNNPSQVPGDAGNYGTIISVSKTVTPTKTTEQVVSRGYVQ